MLYKVYIVMCLLMQYMIVFQEEIVMKWNEYLFIIHQYSIVFGIKIDVIDTRGHLDKCLSLCLKKYKTEHWNFV